jgi:hypothetical protein
MKTQKTLIQIQEEYIETVNAGIQRWGHRKDGGHAHRIRRGARNKGIKELQKIGYTDPKQIDQILRDAHDMAALLRNSEEVA